MNCIAIRRLGQQREDGSGYGSEAFGEGGSDEETRAEVGLTIGKGRPCVLAANILGTLNCFGIDKPAFWYIFSGLN